METRTWMWIAVIFIHKNQTLGTTRTPVSWTDQLNVVYPFNGLLLTHEKNHLLFNLQDGWLPPKYDPSERSQTQHSIWSHWHEFLGQTNLVYVEISQKVARDMGECSGWWVGSVFCFWWRLLHRHIQLSNLINRTPCTLIYDTLIKKYIKNALFSEFWSKFYSRLARHKSQRFCNLGVEGGPFPAPRSIPSVYTHMHTHTLLYTQEVPPRGAPSLREPARWPPTATLSLCLPRPHPRPPSRGLQMH